MSRKKRNWWQRLVLGKDKADAWCVLGASARGASHIRNDLPNQDAIGFEPESGTGPPIRLAVADGHGSPKSFRSDIGAKFAVASALSVLQDFLEKLPSRPNLEATRRKLQEDVPRKIDEKWKAKVERHFQENPFLPEELDKAGEENSPGRNSVEANHVIAYGATILAMLVHELFLACLQLGDGDILLVYDSGVTVRPMDDDERLFANETTSLSAKDCWQDFRIYFQATDTGPPAMVIAATDGYANSFSSETGFWELGNDYLTLLRTQGLKKVETVLPEWLSETSQDGSGDDITMGILCRSSTLNPP